METRTLQSAPADIELGLPRPPVPYHLVTPDAGIDDQTGLLVWLVPWGMSPSDPYNTEKLMPFLANTANCIVCGIEYFGVNLKLMAANKIAIPSNWHASIEAEYGLSSHEDFHKTLKELSTRGVTRLKQIPGLTLRMLPSDYYMSWGLLPAFDVIAVIGEVLKTLQVNKHRLILYGSSYGGYVATMVLKMMPNTFSLAIENSGFTSVIPELMATEEFGKPTNAIISGVGVPVFEPTAWTFKNPDASNYFQPEFAEIRNIVNAAHLLPSKTPLYSFHSTTDSLAPYPPKHTYCMFRNSVAPTHLKSITDADVDGVLFKSNTHGMGASLRGLFTHVADCHGTIFLDDAETDFDRESDLSFACSAHAYRVAYKKSGAVDFQLTPG